MGILFTNLNKNEKRCSTNDFISGDGIQYGVSFMVHKFSVDDQGQYLDGESAESSPMDVKYQ